MNNQKDNKFPLVSVVIPCRNEEKFIGQCLESLIKQEYPKDNLEILIVDGMSDDRTRNIVSGYQEKYSFVKLLDNQKKITPVAFNIGIKESKGGIIILMGAHAQYDKYYISNCIQSLLRNNADNVGGRAIAMPSCDTVTARAIALSVSSRAGSAGAIYKTETGGQALEVDTVFGGCYKKEVFQKIGYFNDHLRRTQDLELNIRLVKSGGKIIFDPSIKAYYYSKATLAKFFTYNIECGKWAIYSWRITGKPLKPRQYVPLVFLLSMILVSIFEWKIGLTLFLFYGLFLVIFSIKISSKEEDKRLVIPLISALACRHFGYGFGSLAGLMKIITCPFKIDF